MAIIDVYSRKILSWQISNTLDAEFCIAALEEAIAIYGVPAIFNTDQGCQFTSEAFTATLDGYSIRISMDGVNRALDNIYIERFWRTLKYEDIYLNDYRTLTELKAGIKRYMGFYNSERFHASQDYQTPDQCTNANFKKSRSNYAPLHRNERKVESTILSSISCVDRRAHYTSFWATEIRPPLVALLAPRSGPPHSLPRPSPAAHPPVGRRSLASASKAARA